MRHRYIQKILKTLDRIYYSYYVYPIAYREMTTLFSEIVRTGCEYEMVNKNNKPIASDDEDNVLSETDEFEVIYFSLIV